MSALRKERSITALALIAILFQLFFATVYLSAPVTVDRSDGSTSFWEICTGAGLIRLDENGNPVAPVPLDGDDCSICASATVAGDIDVSSGADILVPLTNRTHRAEIVVTAQLSHSQFPRVGTSRSPPSAARFPSNFA